MSNTNTEVLTTAYEKLQGALTQSNTVLPKLEEAVEKGNLDNYATISQLEDITKDYAKKTEVNSLASSKAEQSDLDITNARIDALSSLPSGSTTADAELIDIRNKYDGNTSTTAGNAVREQFIEVNKSIENLNKSVFTLSPIASTYDADNYGYYQQGTIVTGTNSDTYSVKFFDVTDIDYVYVTFDTNTRDTNFKYVFFCDNQNNYISHEIETNTATSYIDKKINVPSTATRMIVNYLTAGTSLVVKKGDGLVDTFARQSEFEILKERVDSLTPSTILDVMTATYEADNYGYYQQGTIVTGTTSSVYSSKFFNVSNLKDVYVTFDTNNRDTEFKFIIFADNQNNYLNYALSTKTETNYVDKKVSVPEGVTRMIVNYVTAGTSLVVKREIEEKDTFATKGEVQKLKNNISLLNSVDEEPLDYIDKTGGYAKIFKKVGIIGDSLSSGAQDIQNGGNAFDCWEHSWASYMSIATGCELVKLCKGGLQCANWHSVYETEALKEENKCTAYIIMLGHNDSGETLGTIDDVDATTPSSSSADTTYGRYARIIGTLRQACPDAKIFCVTYPIYYVEMQSINDVARNVSEKLGCYLIDLFKYDSDKAVIDNVWNQDSFGNPAPDKAKVHYTPLGYLRWSWEIMSYIDYIIRKNYSDFTDIGYVNSGHTFDS